MCVGLGVLASGCSISLPLSGFTDATPTGSIEKPEGVVFKTLDQEDGRRARAALAVALDPQGNGASVAWSNPQSGAKGSFVAAAAPFTKGEHICRAFKAQIAATPHLEQEFDGSACRESEGLWRVAEAKELRKTRS